MRRIVAYLLLTVFGLVVGHGCGAEVHGGDSESHFVRCKADETCIGLGPEFSCISGFCLPPTVGDSGPPRPSREGGAHDGDSGSGEATVRDGGPPRNGTSNDVCRHTTYPPPPAIKGAGGDF